MDEAHLRAFAAEHLSEISEQAQVRLLDRARESRQQSAQMGPVPLNGAILRPVTGPQVEALRTDPIFAAAFPDRAVQFAWIDSTKVIAIQVDVSLPIERVPEEAAEALAYFLPHAWDIPVEILPTGLGIFTFLSSSPHLAANPNPVVELDHTRRRLVIQAQKHVNLTQVLALGDRLYCRNGHNRVLAALKAGRSEVPAVVVQGVMPQDIFLGPPPAFFDIAKLLTSVRPPLICDLLTGAALTIPKRVGRFGFALQLSVIPINHLI